MDTHEVLRVISSCLPCRRIEIEGDLYLERFYLSGHMSQRLQELWPEGDHPPLDPTYNLAQGEITTYLHRFYLPDPDRHLHNHPWAGSSRILAGSYTEIRCELTEHDVVDGTTVDGRPLPEYRQSRHFRGENDMFYLEPNTYHRVASLHTRTVWTLFSHGPKVQTWGFLVDGKHVPHREYLR